MASSDTLTASSLDPGSWHPKVKQLYDYWRAVHPPAGLPGRQHIDPIDLPRFLPHLFLVDVERAPLRFRYRLVGTDYVRMMGHDLTGQHLDEVHPGFHGLIQRQYIDLVERRRPAYRKGPVMYVEAMKDHLFVERLVVPLARDGSTVDMILGIILHLR
jgi:hypothetical protein